MPGDPMMTAAAHQPEPLPDVIVCSQCPNESDLDAARLDEDHRDAWAMIGGQPVCCDCVDFMLADISPGERD
jgi:hypothetical protein